MDGIFITELDVSAPAGKRLAVKDLFDTVGVRTTYGSAVFADHVPSVTATAVAVLEAAGYVDVGKTNLHEFAFGTTSQNVHYGTVPNPVAPGRVAGGSSGGSAAALAAGLADVALGTDSGGSIRIPAACCGITGFKPTYGLIPTDGIFPLAPSYDHAGPMAVDVAGCIELMQVLVPGLDVPELELDDLAAALGWLDDADSLVRERVGAAAGRLSARPIELPWPDGTVPIFMHEIGDVHRNLYPEHAELYGENLSPKIERCLEVTDAELTAATTRRASYRDQMTETIGPYDLLLTPTLGLVAPANTVNEIEIRESMVRRTAPFNLLGWPALALPCGPAEDGLPSSIQLVGRPGADALVLAAGLALEAALRPR